ncbi:MAG: hypothetical protein WA324_24290 [Bryobacteraceae bacterium]
MPKTLGALLCLSVLSFGYAADVRFLGCYLVRLEPGWSEIGSGYRIQGRLDLIDLPSRARLFPGHFLPPQGAEIYLDALSKEESRQAIFADRKGNRLVKKVELGIGDQSGLLKEVESVMMDQDVYGRSVPDRYVVSRITVGGTPVQANLRFRSDDSRQNALISEFRSILNSVTKMPGRKCYAGPAQ